MKWQNNRQTSVINPCTIKQFHLKFLMLLVLFFLLSFCWGGETFFHVSKTCIEKLEHSISVLCPQLLAHFWWHIGILYLRWTGKKQQPKYSYWYYLPNGWESVVCVSLFCELHEINRKTVLKFTAYTCIYFGLLLWRLPIC